MRDRRIAHRRPGSNLPGRRFASTLLAAAAALALGCASAAADYPVVNATVYPGTQGSVTSATVALSTLQGNCPAYSGANPLYLYPSAQPFQLPPTETWSLSTVLSCALQIPLSNVSSVQVDSPSRGFSSPLSAADLAAGVYQDPLAQPVISSSGGANTYIRPWRGGADANGDDSVIASTAPITVAVFENGAVLSVTATAHTLSANHGAMVVQFAATVREAGGAVLPASTLTWSWHFGDGPTSASSAPAPEHTYAPPGSFYATVQVSAGGQGGTATIPVSPPGPGAAGPSTHGGAANAPKVKSPAGAERASGTRPGSSPGRSRHTATSGGHGGTGGAGSTTTSASTTTSTTTTSTITSPTTTSSTTTAPPTPSTSPPPPPTTARPATPHRRSTTRPPRARLHTRNHATRAAPGTLVTGRLISDVIALAPGASPLVHAVPAVLTSAPAVRRATRASSLFAPAAALAVILLLALGAGRELRGGRTLRFSG